MPYRKIDPPVASSRTVLVVPEIPSLRPVRQGAAVARRSLGDSPVSGRSSAATAAALTARTRIAAMMAARAAAANAPQGKFVTTMEAAKHALSAADMRAAAPIASSDSAARCATQKMWFFALPIGLVTRIRDAKAPKTARQMNIVCPATVAASRSASQSAITPEKSSACQAEKRPG